MTKTPQLLLRKRWAPELTKAKESNMKHTMTRPFMQALRDAGFKRVDHSRYNAIYSRLINNVIVEVYIWNDRPGGDVNFWHTKNGVRTYADTRGSRFSSIDGMLKAIAWEATRSDLNVDTDLELDFSQETTK